jgi:predicted dehydrogenase
MEINVEEAAAMLLRCPGGAFGTLEVSKIATGTEDELRFEIHGRHGAMRFNLMQPNYLEVYDGRVPDGPYGGRRGWKRIACVQRYPDAVFPGAKFSVGWTRGHVECLHAFLRAIADDAEPSPSLAEGLYLQRVLEAMRASAESGGWVDLPRGEEAARE